MLSDYISRNFRLELGNMLIDPDLTNSKPNPSAFYQSYLSLDEVKIGLEYGKFIKVALMHAFSV